MPRTPLGGVPGESDGGKGKTSGRDGERLTLYTLHTERPRRGSEDLGDADLARVDFGGEPEGAGARRADFKGL